MFRQCTSTAPPNKGSEGLYDKSVSMWVSLTQIKR